MSIKRGSSVDQVGMQPQSNVATSDPGTGGQPIALPDAPMPVNRNDGGSRSIQPGVGVSVVSGPNFKNNTGNDAPNKYAP